ncbi:MAG: DUF1801 domain-containing protein [Acidimicrobiia bacterium]
MSDVDADLERFLEGVAPARRQRDARTMVGLMARATGRPPVLVGSIVGFGSYDYRYPSGREGTGPAAAFAPRRNALVVYLVDGIGSHAEALARLGPHETGVGCVYLEDLDALDLAVLEEIVARSYATLTAGTYTLRAREGGEPTDDPTP